MHTEALDDCHTVTVWVRLKGTAMCRVEFGTIMLWYYTVDRTSLFSYGKKVECTYRLQSWELSELTKALDRQSGLLG